VTTRFGLVIFDCDGVLVDSERLAIRVEAEVLGELGWPLTEAEVVDRFVGRSAAYMQAEVERVLGRPIDWDEIFGRRHHEAYARELVAIDGIPELVGALGVASVPMCVASSSTHDSIRRKLERTGLAGAHLSHVFSVEDVARSKPAPDVFLYAAASMGVDPSDCAVIEDSVAGVEAGLAAGMTVFGFGGGVTARERLAVPGVVVFGAMHELHVLLGVDGVARTLAH
jgi:beta-phosphoglucomutase-like phosphatase (HAD superfamily)